MTVSGWIIFGLLTLVIGVVGACVAISMLDSKFGIICCSIITVALIIFLLFGMLWYYKNTASGQRELIDQKSNFNNGLERTITVYTATGDVIAQYHGQIDIEGNDGGYVIFDFEGKRYMYYNCFVESIADIGYGNSE